MARAAVRAGAKVALIDRDGACAEKAAAEIGAAAWGVGADVTDEAAIAAAMAGAERALGPLTGLVNNAGIAGFGSVHTTEVETWGRIMAVNVTGTFLASKAALSGMLERRRGAIVNFGSVAGLVGIPSMAAYCAAKGAVVSLTRQMAAEYSGQGIRVNVVCPGTVASTDMGRQLLGQDADPELEARRLAKYPIGRFGTPEDIAEAAIFLLSTKAAFVTGCVFAVDGGMTAI
ncbi:short-chain dehydrogenase/reductase SDR (plasmid) [Xanthobacter versatilis]|uniref:Inactive 2-(S)-hydroxypropyl-CoM dehydrogenase 2 n=1 Tax=Xanthobacter autotrophicus (strain ATCC BAA-1158 / Py2) TaxID=78245 RepID=HCDS2_XANP2|nr:RecName: Full=Inactive 2-(S)-hydroxypropyl-CoM dehydrogenase 2; AltName: Full=SHPCDH2 [Xanthobacter autotrophicus Py2]ABS70248.1 short-chain dehydrogenase/reductase SDR [Xanthobacter autotrophicus Py2]